ncbi:MAG: regulatory iron-sulfur-containing complex subunit RicT [Candidatus Gracilibacteria bacterium]|jgi:cell fate regulator YaaT (PSP1 superfamily)|nr:regulatory iron-sulfur-containing complex subunit RicT [Candidatus Gracilibacteria bacterium]
MSEKVILIYDTYGLKNIEIPFTDRTAVRPGDMVVFKDAEDREEFGVIKSVDRPSVSEDGVLKNVKILRPATANDVQKFENYRELSKNAVKSCKEFVTKYGLQMQVFAANYSFDGSRLLFMFTADERIDFRDLVKDLAKTFQKQIYLRQIGPRDKSKIVGGFGKCGRSLCCNTFLNKLESINMEMVRVQALESKGSSKLSGVCGKLLCCLKYEVEAYKDLRLKLPDIDDVVKIKRGIVAPQGTGRVVSLDVLNQKLKIYFTESEEYLVFGAEDIEKVISSGQKYKKSEKDENLNEIEE